MIYISFSVSHRAVFFSFALLITSFGIQIFLAWSNNILLFVFYCLCFWCPIQEIIAKTHNHDIYVLDFLLGVSVPRLQTWIFNPLPIDVCVCGGGNISVQFNYFACRYSIFMLPFVEETIFSPMYLSGSYTYHSSQGLETN